MAQTSTSYDDVPYESHAIAPTQPDRLATLARLFGLETAAPGSCRMLEIGCAAGGNLIPLACRYPGARFTGIDLSPRQIEDGVKNAADLGLDNVTLIERNLMDVDASLGKFDYIVAHGVYSWVPPAVRKKLLEICAANLSATGVAYVSYNTLPGWRQRGAIRDMMRYHVGQFSDPAQRAGQARSLLAFLTTALAEDSSAYAAMLREEFKVLATFPDYHLLHEHLEEENEPVYFQQFAEQAAAAGLQFLCEEDLFTSIPEMLFKGDVLATLQRISPDMLKMEQYSDFLRNRGFRKSLVVGVDRVPQRSISLSKVLELFVESKARADREDLDVQSDSPVRFTFEGGGTLITSYAITRAAMGVLAQRWPETITFNELFTQARAALGHTATGPALQTDRLYEVLAADISRGFAIGVIGLHCETALATRTLSDRPMAFLPARYYAERGRKALPNTRHDVVGLDPYSVHLLMLLDGSRDMPALIEAIAAHVSSGKLKLQQGGAGPAITDPDKVREFVSESAPQALANLRNFAFLVA